MIHQYESVKIIGKQSEDFKENIPYVKNKDSEYLVQIKQYNEYNHFLDRSGYMSSGCSNLSSVLDYLKRMYEHNRIDKNTSVDCNGLTKAEEEAVMYCNDLFKKIKEAKESLVNSVRMRSADLESEVNKQMEF